MCSCKAVFKDVPSILIYICFLSENKEIVLKMEPFGVFIDVGAFKYSELYAQFFFLYIVKLYYSIVSRYERQPVYNIAMVTAIPIVSRPSALQRWRPG